MGIQALADLGAMVNDYASVADDLQNCAFHRTAKAGGEHTETTEVYRPVGRDDGQVVEADSRRSSLRDVARILSNSCSAKR